MGKYKGCQPMLNKDPRRKRKRKAIQNVFEEILVENFPNLKKETDIQVS